MKRCTSLLLKISIVSSLSFSQVWGADLWKSMTDFFEPAGNIPPTQSQAYSQQSIPFLPVTQPTMLNPVYIEYDRSTKSNKTKRTTATTTTTTTTLRARTDRKKTEKVREVPRPPQFKPLTAKQTQELVTKAKSGDTAALELLLERIYWRATENSVLTLDDILKIDIIQKKAMSSRGHIYWHIIRVCKGFSKYPELTDKIKKWAEVDGLATAQDAYGMLYYEGIFGLPKLLLTERAKSEMQAEAVKWWQLSAAQGFLPALTKLGDAYLKGKGIDKNLGKAVQLFHLASDQGYLRAQMLLGKCYHDGNGLPSNELLAFVLLFKSNQVEAHPLIKEMLIPNKTAQTASFFDQESYFNSISDLSIPVSVKLAQISLSPPLDVQSKEEPLSVHFYKTVESYQKWVNAYGSLIKALKSTEPGFMVNCINTEPYLKLALYRSAQEDSKFIKIYCINKCNYIIMGEENCKKSILIRDYLEIYKNTKDARNNLIDFCNKKQMHYSEKIKYLSDLKGAFERLGQSNALTSLERDLLPQKIAKTNLELMAYTSFLPNFEPILQIVNELNTLATEAHRKLSDQYIIGGAVHRNAELLELHPYLKG